MAVETKVPGIAAKHCVITPTCRANRGDGGAFDEAVARCRAEYDAIVAGRSDIDECELHLVLTVRTPRHG